MDRAQPLRLLAEHKPELMRPVNVADLALLGSTARDVARVGRDIDILVSFDGEATSACTQDSIIEFCSKEERRLEQAI